MSSEAVPCSSSDTCVIFKKKTRKQAIRPRFTETDELSNTEEEPNIVNTKDIKDIQKLRRRPAGLSVESLSSNEQPRVTNIERTDGIDPFKLKTGGVVDLRSLKKSEWDGVDVEENIKQTFSKESHLRDEDEEMRRYVEEELARRTGKKAHGDNEEESKEDPSTDNELYQLPDHLKQFQSTKTEEMLSNQMLSGIPEVDLGIDVRIKNIEETESAKLGLLRKLADEKKAKLAEITTARQDIEKTKAQSYVQHSRYKIDNYTEISTEDETKRRERPNTEVMPVVSDDTPKWVVMEKTPRGSLKRPLVVLPGKPTDKNVRDKFVEKEKKWKEDEKLRQSKQKAARKK